MSAFTVAIGGKADMRCCTAYVRLWPKADIVTLGTWVKGALLDEGPSEDQKHNCRRDKQR